jgi:predicted LPLAT superfamily acyltransferase
MEIYEEIKDPVVRIQFELFAEEIEKLKVQRQEDKVEIDSLTKLYVSMKERYGYKIKKIEEMRGY